MKTALLLTGGLRNFEDTYLSFKEYLLNVFDIDVFFYGLENKFGKKSNEERFKELFNPVSFSINNKSYYDKLTVNKNYIPSSYYSFYNVFKCNQLRRQYEIENNLCYDLVIRCRLDVFWFRTISDFEISLAKDYILTPKEWSFKIVNPFALSDVFCITNSNLINKYSDLFNHIDEYCKKIKFHPESLCGYHIMKNNIPNIEIDRHFIFEYPDKNQYQFIPNNFRFIQHFDGQNKDRKDFD